MLISPVLSDMLSAADLVWIIYGLYVPKLYGELVPVCIR